MEKVGTWDLMTVITVLTNGKKLANELKKELHPSTTSREACRILLENILSSYENALKLLGNSNSSQFNVFEFPVSIEGSPMSEGSDQDSKDQLHKSKKRKTMPRWSEQVRVCSGTGVEGQLDDGYNWRKYGQKDILGANHPRAYYRCTHRNTQGCLATKQVQRAHEDPSIFEVIYRGKHSCVQERLKLQKKEENQEKHILITPSKPCLKPENQELFSSKEDHFPSFSFPSTSTEAQNVEAQFFSDPTNLIGPSYYSPNEFLSPATSESYFSLCPVNQSDFAEIMSNLTPAANFAFGDLDFLKDQVDFDSHFLDAADYF